MAFGKPPLQNANVGGWRQAANSRDNARRNSARRRPYAGSRFSNVFKPPVGAPTLVRLIPGEYKLGRAVEIEPGKWGLKTEVAPYFEAIEHRDVRTQQTIICSGGPLWFRKAEAQPCIGCSAYFSVPKDADGRRQGRYTRREIHIFTVLEYGTFARIEQVNAAGLVCVSQKTGKPYTEWVRKTPGLEGILEEKEGHIQHWDVGYGHMEAIKAFDATVSQSCSNCGGMGTIHRYVLICPKCGTDVIDVHTTNLSLDEQEQTLINDIECPYCHNVSPLQEICECACNNPRRASIFDVDFNVQCLDLKGQRQLLFGQHSQPHPIDPMYKAKPLDLAAIFQPDTIETQEKRFGMTLDEAHALLGEENAPSKEPHAHARDYT